MKILYLTDEHFKLKGSMSNESRKSRKYSTRLDLLVKSFHNVYDYAHQNNIDLIVHGGDLLDKPLISSIECEALDEAIGYNQRKYKIPEVYLVGNHCKVSDKDTALSVLRSYQNLTVVDTPTRIGELVFVPYTRDYQSATEFMLNEMHYPTSVIFTHLDIYGTDFGNVKLSSGIVPLDLYSKYTLIINGHLHNATDNTHYPDAPNIINGGSFMGTSLSDDYKVSLPCFMIIDTSTTPATYTRVVNDYATRYYSLTVDTVSDLVKSLNSLLSDQSFKGSIYLRLKVPYTIKPECREVLSHALASDDRLESVVVIDNLTYHRNRSESIEISTEYVKIDSPYDAISSYVSTLTDKELPASKEKVLNFMRSEYNLKVGDNDESSI